MSKKQRVDQGCIVQGWVGRKIHVSRQVGRFDVSKRTYSLEKATSEDLNDPMRTHTLASAFATHMQYGFRYRLPKE